MLIAALYVHHAAMSPLLPETEGHKAVAGSLVELGLELDPVQAEGVEEGGQSLHQHCNQKLRHVGVLGDTHPSQRWWPPPRRRTQGRAWARRCRI